MQIQFVNHAGFIVSTGNVTLLCDPWLVGRSFNDGWELLAPTAMEALDFGSITHLWFSHEHPDHFSPVSLKAIPEEDRARITVLFQKTVDRKVVRFCEKLGFGKVVELEPRTWTVLDGTVELLCTPLATEWDADSWMCLRDGQHTLLNINDCGVEEKEIAEDIRGLVGEVDLLMTQFSFAAWAGNPEEVQIRRGMGAQILDNIRLQIEVLEPKQVVPFASFIWFCHPENFAMNADANRIEAVEDAIRSDTEAEPVVLYPGDVWAVGEPHDPSSALARYIADRERILGSGPSTTSEGVTEADLMTASAGYVAKLREVASPLLMQLERLGDAGKRHGFPRFLRSLFHDPDPGLAWVHDLERAYAFDVVRGLRAVDLPREACHVEISSDSLHYALRFLWGAEAMQVNGRFVELGDRAEWEPGEGADRFFRHFRLARGIDLGRELTWDAALQAARRRIVTLFPSFEVRETPTQEAP